MALYGNCYGIPCYHPNRVYSRHIVRNFHSVPVHLYEMLVKLRRVERELAETLNRDPTHEELSKAAGIPVAKIDVVMRAYRTPMSMDAALKPGEDSAVGDLVEDASQASPEQSTISNMMMSDLENVLLTLSEREAAILRLRYGLDDGVERTLEEIGKMFNVRCNGCLLSVDCCVDVCVDVWCRTTFILLVSSTRIKGRPPQVTRERIRQIEAKSIRKLRHPSRNAILAEYTDSYDANAGRRGSGMARRS